MLIFLPVFDCSGDHGGNGFCQREANESFSTCYIKEIEEFSVSLISSNIILIVSHCVLKIYFFNILTLERFKGFVILGILVSVVSYFSYRRAKYCALLLFNAREKLIFHASL
jgi:hypothetical protein